MGPPCNWAPDRGFDPGDVFMCDESLPLGPLVLWLTRFLRSHFGSNLHIVHRVFLLKASWTSCNFLKRTSRPLRQMPLLPPLQLMLWPFSSPPPTLLRLRADTTKGGHVRYLRAVSGRIIVIRRRPPSEGNDLTQSAAKSWITSDQSGPTPR
jgi:hypothetical protein